MGGGSAQLQNSEDDDFKIGKIGPICLHFSFFTRVCCTTENKKAVALCVKIQKFPELYYKLLKFDSSL